MYIYFLTIWIILDILYRFYHFIVLTVPNAHDCNAVHLPSIDSKNLVTMVFMTSLSVDSYEKRKRVGFCCFKRCTRCISIKAFTTLKKNSSLFMGFQKNVTLHRKCNLNILFFLFWFPTRNFVDFSF